jgi:hypothetical protein
MQIDEVATAPPLCRAVMVMVAKDLPSWWRVA